MQAPRRVRWIGPLLLAACGSSSSGDASTTDETSADATEGTEGTDTGPEVPDYGAEGPHPVGNATIQVDVDDVRSVSVELWYPAVEDARAQAEAGVPLASFGRDDAQTTALSMLSESADPTCTRLQTRSAPDAAPAEGTELLPVVLFSHCHSCTRFSSFSVAERLASHGFVVAGVDHPPGTIFEELEGEPGPLDGEFLTQRSLDVRAALDAVLADHPDMPAGLHARLDPNTVGMFGHSFGAATTGRVLQDDDRVQAGAALAAPVESPLLPGVAVAEIDEPMLFLLAREDNSITELGNNLIRSNYDALASEAWLAEVTDAGHWSFSDLCGVIDGFQPCCGEGTRQTDMSQTFTYLDAETGRTIASDLVTAFFALHLRADETARPLLDASNHPEVVEVTSHP